MLLKQLFLLKHNPYETLSQAFFPLPDHWWQPSENEFSKGLCPACKISLWEIFI